MTNSLTIVKSNNYHFESTSIGLKGSNYSVTSSLMAVQYMAIIGSGIWQLIAFRPPGICKQQQNLLRNILSSFPTELRVKGFKYRHFGIRRAFIDHKRPKKGNKAICCVFFQFSWSDSFRDLFYAVLSIELSYVY